MPTHVEYGIRVRRLDEQSVIVRCLNAAIDRGEIEGADEAAVLNVLGEIEDPADGVPRIRRRADQHAIVKYLRREIESNGLSKPEMVSAAQLIQKLDARITLRKSGI
jgi:autonomous glycyl radical cofactor GrcA